MRLSNQPINDLIGYFISSGKEGDCWDFKQEWGGITDIVKDIICFANTVHDEDCYLIFGISDDFELTGMQKERKKQADIIDALSNLSFAGDNIPKIALETIEFKGVELDILKIFDTDKTPIYLKRPYGNMKQGCIYTRNGDKNTPDNGNAEILEIENLWRKKLGLTKPPLEYIVDRLQNKFEWNESGEFYYNKFRPEYFLRKYEDEDFERGDDKFYSYSQMNEATSYSMLDIVAYNTILDSYQIVSLDSGRLSVPVPEWGYIELDRYHQDTRAYKYYVEGSDRWKLLCFMYSSENPEERMAFQNLIKVVLLYHSKEEQKGFEGYIEQYPEKLKSLVDKSNEYDYINTESKIKTKEYKKELRTGRALSMLLEEMRNMGI